MEITLEMRKQYKDIAQLYRRLKTVYDHMKHRCDNPHDEQYCNYGARGVTYCDDWNTLAGFIKDVDKIDGWNLDKFLDHKIQLDKDYKHPERKMYSLDNCCWISRQRNMRRQPSRQKPFYGYNEYTQAIFDEISPMDAVDKYHLNQYVIYPVLKGKKHRTNHWYLWFKDKPAPKVLRYYAKLDNKLYWDINPTALSKQLGYEEGYIGVRLKKGDSRFWVKEIDVSKLVKAYEEQKLRSRD